MARAFEQILMSASLGNSTTRLAATQHQSLHLLSDLHDNKNGRTITSIKVSLKQSVLETFVRERPSLLPAKISQWSRTWTLTGCKARILKQKIRNGITSNETEEADAQQETRTRLAMIEPQNTRQRKCQCAAGQKPYKDPNNRR